ncbi:MAG: purine-nucleoside phosphorylase [Francisellaceae bacterium]
MIPTPHIEVTDKSKFAKTVIMPGDPLRAKFIAETFLENAECINTVRGMLGYTGFYKGKRVSVMGSGMGMPSIGIYSYELFAFYDVERIVRIGSCGSYTADLNLYDVVLVTESHCESDFIEIVTGEKTREIKPSAEFNDELKTAAKTVDVELIEIKAHSTDVFYRKNFDDYKKMYTEYGCEVAEMETAALFANAVATGKQAACLLTVSDSLVTHESTSSDERQNAFTKMMEVALESVK